MDIGKLNTGDKARQGVKVFLKDPSTGEKLPFFVVIYGPGSPRHDQAIKVFDQRAGRKKSGGITPQRIKAGYIVTKAWGTHEDGKTIDTIKCDGSDLEFNEGNFSNLIKDLPWILDDIDDAASSTDLFLPDGNEGSSSKSGQKGSAKPQKQ